MHNIREKYNIMERLETEVRTKMFYDRNLTILY